METIHEFNGEYRYLSNFWPAKITMYGAKYPSVENAYQAAKEQDPKNRAKYINCSPAQAKKMGKLAKIIPNWNIARLLIMEELVRRKFQIPELRQKLIATGNAELIEGNHWNDTFWGICNGNGENNLGKILMKIRHEINPILLNGQRRT